MLNNIIANYVGRAYSIAAIYLFVPFYVKILGVEAYGVIAAYAILLTLSSLADIGLSATFSREAARSSDNRLLLDLMATIERILILTVGLVALAVFIGAEYIATHWFNVDGKIDQQSIVWSFRLMALMVIPQICISLYSAGLIGLQKQVAANLIQALFITVRSGLVVFPILWRPELPVFFGWQLTATLIFAVMTRLVLVRKIGFSAWPAGRFDAAALKTNLVFAGGMMWISIVAGINTQIDKLVVSKMFSLTDFGYYTLAGALAQVPVALATPIAVAFYPHITTHVARGDKRHELQTFETYSQWIALFGALGAFGVALFAPDLLALWLQDPSLPSVVARVSAMLAIGSLFLCLGMPSYYLGLAHGKSVLIATLITFTLVFSIPLIIVAINTFGLWGAAIPWIILNLANFAFMLIFIVRRHVGEVSIARIVFAPTIIAFLPLAGAHSIAKALQVSPALTCVFAGVGALCALLVFCSTTTCTTNIGAGAWSNKR